MEIYLAQLVERNEVTGSNPVIYLFYIFMKGEKV